VEAAAFDEAAVEAGLASGADRCGESRAGNAGWAKARPEVAGCDMGRQRLRRQLGARSRTPRPGDIAGGAVDRGTRQDRAISRSRVTFGVNPEYHVATRWASRAEAGGSPSSDAPPR